jgi:5'-deoxynucleotidase YfbR-like HD superfamily hydrolase
MSKSNNVGRGEPGWIQTASGGKFSVASPNRDLVNIRDIAKGLSSEARFNGHARGPNGEPYTVAQHSVMVMQQVALEGMLAALSSAPVRYFPHHIDAAGRPEPILLCLQALFHDATEAYGLRDVASPIKQLPEMEGYRQLEKGVHEAVFSHLGLPVRLHSSIKAVDYSMGQTEALWFLGDLHPDWEVPAEFPPYTMERPRVWGPAEAESMFLDSYRHLNKAAADFRREMAAMDLIRDMVGDATDKSHTPTLPRPSLGTGRGN